jgi:integrase
LSRRTSDVDLENGFLILDYQSSKNRTEYKWPLIGEFGDLVTLQMAEIRRAEHKLRREIRWLFHRDGERIPYGTLYDAWRAASKEAGYPRKLMHDFRRTAATRLDSTPGISRTVAMTLLGHKTEIMFWRYIQSHDERLIEAAKTLAERQQAETTNAKLANKTVTNP